ncbi:MAG: TonB-dependent receptor [Acidobacteria bacterium]|nr:TonB-dependent receptor [Acidobacteriota bacterium]
MEKIQWKVCVAILVVMLLSTVHPIEAQLTRGFVSGTVTDATGAILAGVQVTITNKATNIARDIVTNDVGFYRFVAVEPGDYAVEFRLAGFETRKVDNITVRTAQEVVLNQTLAVGGVTAEVTVTETPGVELAKTIPTIERTFTGRLVTELPLNTATRTINVLALLAPTVNQAPGSTGFSANGQRARNNNFMIDGVDNNDASVTISSARILPEAVQEVQVQTSAYSAEFGHSSGAQVSVVTKSGTNQYHGEAWDYYRGNWMEPVSLINKRSGNPVLARETPRFNVNQFGGDMGGPILRDRTFFFGLSEWNRRREAPDARNASSPTIPTPAGYTALSTVPLRAAAGAVPAQSTASRQAALSALSFLSGIHPQVANYDNLRNVTINGVPIQVGSIRIPLANPHNFYYSAGRVDHKLSDEDNISYRFHLDKRDQPDVTSNLGFGTKWSASQTILRQNHAISYTRTFGSRFLNEARAAYVRGNLDFPENDPTSPTVGITGFFTIGGASNFPQGRVDHNWQYQDVATYTAGRHSMKFGLDLRKYWLFNRSGFDSKGTWSFPNLADFLNNNALSLNQAVNEASFLAKQWNHGYFFQDDFKATKDLTFNFGLRYEYSQVPLGFFGAEDPAVRAVGVPGPARPDKNNWAPRFGFAYSPSAPGGMLARLLGNGKTSIRGGFGMSYDVLFFNILTVNANNFPRVVNSTTNPPATIDLFPTLAPKTSVVPTLNPLNTWVNAPEDIKSPTTNFWSLSVQRELATNYTVEVGYTGNRSYHQIRQGQTNAPILTAAQAATVISTQNANSIPGVPARRLNPNWGSRVTIESTAKAEYHAGYVKFDKRMSRGLLIGANYTFSGNWSDNDESLAVGAITNSSPQIPQDFFNYRNEWSRYVFDRPHRFVVHYTYEIPWFSSGWASEALSKVLGGWQMSGFTEVQSGQPFTIRTGADTAGIGTTTPARPNLNPGGVFTKDPVTNDLRTFTIPTNGTGIVVAPLGPNGILGNSMPGGGNLGRNTFRGPEWQNWNFNLLKRITITEDVQIQLRSDFINLWNHNNFANPIATMSSPTFGQNTADLNTDARLILFSAKVKF